MINITRAHLIALIFLVVVPILMVLVSWLSNAPISLAGPAETTMPNVIFVVVDTLRADHLISYGYTRDTSPNLESRVARQGVLFNDVTASSSWTNPANGAIFTSHWPSNIDTHWSDLEKRIPAEEKLLAEYLHDAGYVSAGFVSNWWLQAQYGYAQGFDHYEFTERPDRERAYLLNQRVKTWLDDNLVDIQSSGQPLHLFLYYMDPHTTYDPPPPYDTLYDSTYTGTLTGEVFGHGEPVVSGEIIPTERDIEHLLALYDGEITYWDVEFGMMLDYLATRGVLSNSIIIVTSDHGEMFGEHNLWTHGNSLYEEVLRVPLMISYPGKIGAGQIVPDPVQMVDIAPTLLDLIGAPIPGDIEGQSLVPLMSGNEPAAEARPIFSEMAGALTPDDPIYWLAPHNNLYSVKKDGYKLIVRQQVPAAEELFLVKDNSLYEEKNLIDDEPQKATELFEILREQFNLPTEYLFMPVIQNN